jgi:hypothetical protein
LNGACWQPKNEVAIKKTSCRSWKSMCNWAAASDLDTIERYLDGLRYVIIGAPQCKTGFRKTPAPRLAATSSWAGRQRRMVYRRLEQSHQPNVIDRPRSFRTGVEPVIYTDIGRDGMLSASTWKRLPQGPDDSG